MDEKTLYYYNKAIYYSRICKNSMWNTTWAYYYAKLAAHWANNAIHYVESK